jgi:hypothetical protein
MGRATFEGPILSGDNRFGPLRNIGYTDLVQQCDFSFANTVVGTSGYAGNSGQFVNGNQIPNVNAVVYSPSSTVYPPVAVTPTADAATTVYRGAVMYLPYGTQINDMFVDIGTAITVTSGALTGAVVNIGNQFNGTQYGSITLTVATNAITAGRYTPTFTGAQLTAMQASTGDITNPPSQYGGGGGTSPYNSLVSQVVFTLVLTGTGTPAPNAGTMFTFLRYAQLDPAIGNQTTYPYGNFG